MRVILAAAVGALTISVSAEAQSIPTHNIHPAEIFAEPFSSLGSMRAVSGGDLLVTDRIEKAVYKINFRDGSYEMIGLNGQGPQEYDMPTGVLPVGDRTSAIIDIGNTRVAVMDEEGRISATYPMISESGFKMPSGGDHLGNLYYRNMGRPFRMGPSGRRVETERAPTEASITRWNLATGDEKTVATVAIPARPPGGGSIRIMGGQISGMPAPTPLRPLDAFAVAPDGRIGIARHSPYHVEWVNPDGSIDAGDNVDYAPIPFRHSDKEGWIESQSPGGSGAPMVATFTTISSEAGGGGGTRTFSMPTPDIDEVDFPDVFPPFTRGAVRISHEGDLWVQRVESYSVEGTLFDVFDSSGRLVRKVRIPEGRTILGFGPHSLYAYTTDEDDLQWLEKYEI